ncbi:hypothetical protein [Gorillibacterium timonense]|uniref:hypothetical protein n=1 Tax=Gorillibacterium timonense TaxID=1689269 RepID=UPI00071DAA8C|nr:hypothetical protein [Gorillibacterium timonense]
MALTEFLEKLLTTVHLPVTFGPHDPVSLSRWLVRAVTKPASRSWGDKPYLDESGRILLTAEANLLAGSELEDNWSYYNSDIIGSFQEPNEPSKRFERRPDRYLYAVTNMYSPSPVEMLLYVITFLPSPLRLWINGEPIILASEDWVVKDLLVRVRLKQGNNPILVELPLGLRYPLTSQEFLLRFQPLARLEREKDAYAYLDWERFEGMKRSLVLYPEKWKVAPGELLRITVVPRYAGVGHTGKPIEVILETRSGERLTSETAQVGSVCALAIPKTASGVLVLKARGAGLSAKAVFLFAGDEAAMREKLLSEVALTTQLSAGEAESFRQLMQLPHAFESLNQYMPYDIRETLLEKLDEMETALATNRLALSAAASRRIIRYRLRETGDAYLAYTVLLPDGYDPGKSYPGVFFFHDAMARNYPVDLPWIKDLSQSEAVIIQIVGIGRSNYTDDLQTVRTIRHVAAEWKLDRDRLYGIGFCTGTHKTYRTAFAVPDLFAAIASVAGEIALNIHKPEYAWLDNLGDMPVLGVCAYENWFFNSTRLIDLWGRLPEARTAVYSGFMHNELNALHNSRVLLRQLLTFQKDRFPRWIAFAPPDPCFVKSHWVQIIWLSVPGDSTRVQADILSSERIELETRNIDRLRVVLSRKDLGLDEDVVLFVNGSVCSIHLGGYTSIELDTSSAEARIVSTELMTPEAFEKWYQDILIDENQMGMKRIYLGKCAVVRPAVRSSLFSKLAYLLQNPIKDRYIFYRYDTCREAELSLEEPGERHLIVLVDARDKTPLQQRLLNDVGLTAEASGICWGEEAVEGEYFAMVCTANPYRPDRMVLFAVTNTDAVEEEWIALLNSFDTNPVFYYNALIYHRGRLRTGFGGSVVPAAGEGVR